MKYFRFFKITAVLFSIMLFSSCFEIDYYINIKEDGTEEVTVKLKSQKDFDFTKEKKQLQDRGYSVSEETRNDSIYVTATQTFAAGKWQAPYPFNMLRDSIKLDQSYAHGFTGKTYHLAFQYTLDSTKVDKELDLGGDETSYHHTSGDDNSLFRFASLENDSGDETGVMHDSIASMGEAMDSLTDAMSSMGKSFDIPVRYHITLPGRITMQQNATVTGNTLNFSYKLEGGENVNIDVASEVMDYTYLLIGGGMILFAVIIFLYSKRRKNSTVS